MHIIVTVYNEVIVTLFVSLYEMTNHFYLCLGLVILYLVEVCALE